MDNHDRYTNGIQHEITLLKTGKANYAILSKFLIIFEIPDDIERVYESWNTITTTFEYEDEQY